MKCPKCGSHKVRSYDNEPLYHPCEGELKSKDDYDTRGIDNEVYFSTICDDCGHKESMNFNILTDYTDEDIEALNTILENLDSDSDLEKSLKKVIETFGSVKNNSDICKESIKNETMKNEVLDNTYNTEEVLRSLEAIESDEVMTTKLRDKFGTDFDVIKACIKGNLIKPEAINLILRIAPVCYKINGKVFLKGDETKNEFDFIGEDMDYQKATELFDMTTEMGTGDSYSFYVSSLGFFELASPIEIVEVKNFLNNLK